MNNSWNKQIIKQISFSKYVCCQKCMVTKSLLFAAIFKKTFQKEGQEVGEGVELTVIANGLLPVLPHRSRR